MYVRKTAILLAGLAVAVLPCGPWQAATSASEPPLARSPSAILPSADDSAQGQSAEASDAVMLNSRTFNIPFRVDEDGTPPAQVELYVARGPGQPWQQFDQQPPTIREFQFAAAEDGVYWFATRTRDASGRSHPASPLTPQLKVVVDTASPQIDLLAEADDRGQIELQLVVDDSTPIQTLQLQYATDVSRQWQPLESGQLRAGQTFEFAPAGPWQQVYLHAVAVDAAGNQGTASKRVQRPRVASRPSTPLAAHPPVTAPPTRAAGFRTPFPASPAQPNVSPMQPTRLPTAAAPDRATTDATTPLPAAPPMGRSTFGTAAWPGTAPQPGNQAGNPPRYDRLPPPAAPSMTGQYVATDADISLNGPDQVSGQDQFSGPDPNPENHGDDAAQSQTADQPRPRSAAEALRPLQTDTLTSQSEPRQTANRPESTPAPANVPPAPAMQPSGMTNAEPRSNTESIPLPADVLPNPSSSRPSQGESSDEDPRSNAGHTARIDLAELERQIPVRFSNSIRFSLEYELEAIGNQGVEAVELWGTVDAGKNWKRWGTDPDLTSPFDIETLGEGIFGYRSVVVGRNGLVSPSPLDGDLPDIAIVVDTTKPEVRMTSVRYGEGDRIGSLVIRYDCRDRYLTTRPITLSFSDQPDGPWTTIAAGLRNEGEYVWPADPELPRKIYLRIDAVDRADNVGTYILDRPVEAQGLAPRAKIRAFRAVTGTPSANGRGANDERGTTANREQPPRR